MEGQTVTSTDTVKEAGVGSLAFSAVLLNRWHHMNETWAVITAITVRAPGR